MKSKQHVQTTFYEAASMPRLCLSFCINNAIQQFLNKKEGKNLVQWQLKV